MDLIHSLYSIAWKYKSILIIWNLNIMDGSSFFLKKIFKLAIA